jgi:LPXTG-site transpeptidase (sortase) family protein
MVKIRGFKKSQKIVLISSIFVIVIIATILFLLEKKKTPEITEVIDISGIVTISTDVPDEKEPEEFYVAPDMPKRIVIPGIAVSGYIQLVGIDQDNRIAVPSNVHIAGWYINSVRPGEVGLSIIDGHRDGTSIGGIFRNVEKLNTGDNFQIEYGDGSTRDFNVVEVKQVSIEDAYDLMYEKRDSIERQLNLVSCGGKYSKTLGTYEDRIIIIAQGI